jgi:SAM-dependent methyltransferase
MSHRSAGVHQVLSWPRVYERFQLLMGGWAARRRFVEQYLRPFDGARILDVGCGAGSLLEHLPLGVEYVGFDINQRCIDYARRRYGDRGRFFCARAGENAAVDGQRNYDFVIAKSLLHHLSDRDAEALLAVARRLLRSGGSFVSLDPVLHPPQKWLARFLISLDRGTNVRSPEQYRQLATTEFEDLEEHLLTDLLPIPYSHFVMRARS